MMLSREECQKIAKASKPDSSDGKTFICEWHNPSNIRIKIKKSICLVNKQDGSVVFVCKNCANNKLKFTARDH